MVPCGRPLLPELCPRAPLPGTSSLPGHGERYWSRHGFGRVLDLPDGVPARSVGLLSLGGSIAAVSPLLLWQMLHPLPLKLDVGWRVVGYEFADRDYAEEFASLNNLGTPRQ